MELTQYAFFKLLIGKIFLFLIAGYVKYLLNICNVLHIRLLICLFNCTKEHCTILALFMVMLEIPFALKNAMLTAIRFVFYDV